MKQLSSPYESFAGILKRPPKADVLFSSQLLFENNYRNANSQVNILSLKNILLDSATK